MRQLLSKAVISLMIVAAVMLTFGVQTASAHGDDGSMEVLDSQQVGPRRIRLEVAIPYSNDGDQAENAIVTASLTGPDGQTVTDVALPRTAEATYAAEVDVPTEGAWTIEVASTDPTAAASIETVVRPEEAATTTTVAPATTRPSAESPSTEGRSETELAAPANRSQENGGIGAGAWLAGAGGLFVLLVLGAAAVRFVPRWSRTA